MDHNGSTSRLAGARVLVTGGAGFIGSEVVRRLVSLGSTVCVLDNLVNGKEANLRSPDARCRLVVGDIRDEWVTGQLVRQADIVIHMACLGVRHSLHSPVETHDVNATATLSLLRMAHEAGVERFVHISTSEVYGTAEYVPMPERHPTQPSTVYGASKLAGERYAAAFHHTYGLPVVVVRPFNAFGPRSHHEGDCGEVIPKFMLRAMAGQDLVIHGNGSQTRDFTFVSDTARGITLAAVTDDAVGATINLGSGFEVTVDELATRVEQVVGRPVRRRYGPARPADVRRLYSDSTLARQILGFVPEWGLSAGLTALHDWYRGLDSTAEELLQDEVEQNWLPSKSDVPLMAGATR